MKDVEHRVSELRRRRNDIESHVIDEFVTGRIDRREFFRRGSVLGMSMPLLAFLAAACGGSSSPATTAVGTSTDATGTTAPAPKAGGTIRISATTPATGIEPIAVNDTGGLVVIALVGEWLVYEQLGKLSPGLAESWTPNTDGSEWIFKIRSGVNFQDGTPMTAADCAATINANADPKNGGNALSAFGGVVSAGAASAPDATTLVVTLDAPNANFPYYVSNTNYNLIILPASYKIGTFEQAPNGTGPFKLDSYTPKQGAKYSRFDGYWGPKALPDAVEMTFAPDEQPRVLALQGGQTDVVDQISVAGSPQLLNDPSYSIISVRGSTHRQLSMRCDIEPFNDKRIRQAIGLTLDRASIVQGLFQGQSDLGNDSPFAPIFAQTDPSVPQRAQDLAKAKDLLAQAGKPNGFSTQMNVYKNLEMPAYAQIVADGAKKIGIDIKLLSQDAASYYGDAVFGKSPWLDSVMSMVDYGHRGVPNVFLTAPLQTIDPPITAADAGSHTGAWNAAHFANASYDKLVADFIGTIDVPASQKLAGQIQQLLLDETPIIFAYFYFYLSATTSKVTGVRTSAMGQVWLDQASIAS